MFTMAGFATHAQETVFEAAAFEVVFELTLNLVGQGRALRDHPVGELRVVRIDELVE
jgi:hypothetical protein